MTLPELANHETQADCLAANGDFRGAIHVLRQVTDALRERYGIYDPRELRLTAKEELGTWPMF
jgi:hypothetical protein